MKLKIWVYGRVRAEGPEGADPLMEYSRKVGYATEIELPDEPHILEYLVVGTPDGRLEIPLAFTPPGVPLR